VPITVADPFKGRQYPGEVIVQAVRWYLRYPLAYEHVAELLAERGLGIDARKVRNYKTAECEAVKLLFSQLLVFDQLSQRSTTYIQTIVEMSSCPVPLAMLPVHDTSRPDVLQRSALLSR
jgi:hypothetical protein